VTVGGIEKTFHPVLTVDGIRLLYRNFNLVSLSGASLRLPGGMAGYIRIPWWNRNEIAFLDRMFEEMPEKMRHFVIAHVSTLSLPLPGIANGCYAGKVVIAVEARPVVDSFEVIEHPRVQKHGRPGYYVRRTIFRPQVRSEPRIVSHKGTHMPLSMHEARIRKMQKAAYKGLAGVLRPREHFGYDYIEHTPGSDIEKEVMEPTMEVAAQPVGPNTRVVYRAARKVEEIADDLCAVLTHHDLSPSVAHHLLDYAGA